MSTAKEKSATVAKIGLIGAALTSLLDLLELSNQDVIKFLQGLIPFISAFIYECWSWVAIILTPASAESLKARRAIKKAIKQINVTLKDTTITDSYRLELQAKKEKLMSANIDNLTDAI